MKTLGKDASFVATVQHLIWLAGGRSENFAVVEAYLNELPEKTVLKLQTFVYFGCGDDEDIERLHRDLREDTEDKADAVRTISEKLDVLSEYFTCALKLAREQGMDLEGDFLSACPDRRSRRRRASRDEQPRD